MAVQLQAIKAHPEFCQVKKRETIPGDRLSRFKTNLHMTTKHENVVHVVIIEHKTQWELKASLVLIKVLWPNRPSVIVSLTLWWRSVHALSWR